MEEKKTSFIIWHKGSWDTYRQKALSQSALYSSHVAVSLNRNSHLRIVKYSWQLVTLNERMYKNQLAFFLIFFSPVSSSQHKLQNGFKMVEEIL